MSANRPLVLSTSEPYVPPTKSDYFFIVWNLYLTDKLTPLTKDRLGKEGIAEIIAILPEQSDFQADVGDIPVTVLAYHHNHTPVLPREQYDEMAKKIDEIAKRPRNQPRNILVFCNNGYQRSLPFLAYYMIHYHKDEFPTVEKALGYLLDNVGSRNTYEEKVKIIEQVKQLFDSE